MKGATTDAIYVQHAEERKCTPTVADDNIVTAQRRVNVVYGTVALPTNTGPKTVRPQYRIRQQP